MKSRDRSPTEDTQLQLRTHTYSLIDRIFRLSLGELADFSGAKYDGDFSLTLERRSAASTSTSPSRSGSGRGGGCSTSAAAGGRCSNFVRSRGGDGVGRDALLRAGRGVPAQRPRRAPRTTRAQVTRETLRRLRRGRQPRRLRALLLARGLPRRTPGARSTATSSPTSRACCPTGGRLYLQTMVFGRNMIPARGRRHRRAARLRRLVPGAACGTSSPARSCRSARSRSSLRRAALPARVERERPARLHRDDQPVAQAVRRAEPPEDAAQAAAGARAG